MSSDKGRKDKNQNIQVFVRLRPLNQREKDLRSIGVVDVNNSKEVVAKFSQQTNITKKFTFDKAFGPNATQLEIYQEVVSPLIEEVLAGYNCTVFAYGQTGTGKTHTMVGEHTNDEACWQEDPMAGIIPRALSQLFDELRISNTEYTVRVSYLELYNEELFDLLSSSEDNSKLRIYEDVTRKGSNIVNGLEEITVYNKKEVYKIMSQGQERKKVASTLMNAQSSRSHTVFTIVIHMKENSPEGEELVKIGKLNLVDLAGSENISKAGTDIPSKKERARECVNINQSLLTLGRVITALVERHPHVPYRESKLTRILQESLGGRTKTSIIATVSPGHKDLEETLSTLEYAHRAKNIQNKPEVNQKMTKKAMLKEYVEEIDRLKRDLQAARDKNGVYLPEETFTEMTLNQEEQKKEIQELLLKIKAMEDEKDKTEDIFLKLHQTIKTKDTQLNATKNQLNLTKTRLSSVKDMLKSAREHGEEQEHLVLIHNKTEQMLSTQAQALLSAADVATEHVSYLHDNIDKRRTLETCNLQVTKTYREQSSRQRERISTGVNNFTKLITNDLTALELALDNHMKSKNLAQLSNNQKLDSVVKNIIELQNQMQKSTGESLSRLSEVVDKHRSNLAEILDENEHELVDATDSLLQRVVIALEEAERVDIKGNVAGFVQQWYSGASARVSSVRRSHTDFQSGLRLAETERFAIDQIKMDVRREHLKQEADNIQQNIAQLELQQQELEKQLSKRIDNIEAERRQAETRLSEWLETVTQYIATEKTILQTKMKNQIEEIEEDRISMSEITSKQIVLQRKLFENKIKEMEMSSMELEERNNFKEQRFNCIDKYGKKIDEGMSAVSIDMEALTKNVVEVVEHGNNEITKTIVCVKNHIQDDVESLMAADNQRSTVLRSETQGAFQGLLQISSELNESTIRKLQLSNTDAMQDLNEVSSSLTTLINEDESCVLTHSAAIGQMKDQVCSFKSDIVEAVEEHSQLEGRHLAEEYRLYSPTGKTPSRTEYRYPRTLAASSPRDRILARFRAARQNNDHEDCVVVESDSETDVGCPSDSSSLSEESSNGQPTLQLAPDNIINNISENDIHVITKTQNQRGKENSVNSMTKKVMKLPAIYSKIPLKDRNGADGIN